MRMSSVKKQATILRDQGYSYNMIKNELNVSLSTMSYWFSDRPYTPNAATLERIKNGSAKNGIARHNERVESTKQTISAASKEIGKITQRDLWLLGLGIYIGEGSKSIESVRIVNSDPDVIRISLRWFREVCDLTDENLILSLNIYPDINESEAIDYWSEVTGLPKSNFRKTQVDIRNNKSNKLRHKLSFGTIQIRVRANGDKNKGVVLFRRIKGWTKGALDQV